MDKEIEIIAKKYNLDSNHDKKTSSLSLPNGSPDKYHEERISYKLFDCVNPPTLYHKRLEDKLRFLELENRKLCKKILELTDKNSKLSQDLSRVQNSEDDCSLKKSQKEDEEKNLKLEYEKNLEFYKAEVSFLIESTENDRKIKEEEISFLRSQVNYFTSLPNIESLSLLKDNMAKMHKDNEILKANLNLQEEIIEKLKKELSLSSVQESQEIYSITQQLKNISKQLDHEKNVNKKLVEENFELTALIKSAKYELHLEKCKNTKFDCPKLLS